MIKWIAIGFVAVIVVVIAIRIIKVMIKTEKDDKQASAPAVKEEAKEYVPQEVAPDIQSASSAVPMADFNDNANLDDAMEYKPTGFTDHLDDEFFDYSSHLHSRKSKKRNEVDFDLDGEMADDDFEYIPSTAEFGYLPMTPPKPKKKTLEKSLNEMPTELKVLMLSDIFDRKFFD